jgi:exodeoxyribonuclease VII large subunit
MNETVFTVTQLNNHIKGLLELDPMLQNVCVKGELSNYKVYPSGHHYFTLKDAEGSIRCVMFRSSASKLRFRPESGMGVTAFGRVSVYPRDGAYQLYCTDMQPQGMGDLHVAYEQLKAKLDAEGLFAREHKKPIPRFPERIAVITSGAGAAVRDIIRVSGKRWPMAKIIVLPVRVQGTEAPAEIVGAINYANRYQVADLIITGRGGGSIEDLWAFNDERVARAIYASEIPVISAVGHEPDVTIADFVADLRAATPSNGAELALPDQAEMRESLMSVEIRAFQAMKKRLEALRRSLDQLSARPVLVSPTGYIDQKRMELDYLRTRLTSSAEKTVSAGRHEYVRLAASLDALSPLKVLTRGYAVATRADGNVLRRVSDADEGEMIDLRLSNGSLSCRVEGVSERTDGNE